MSKKSSEMDYKSLWSLALKYSDNLFLILSEDLKIREINPAAQKMLGWKKKEVINQEISSVFKKNSTQAFIDITEAFKKTKTFTQVLNNNQNLKILWQSFPLYNKQKEPKFVYIIGKNATELTDKQFKYIQLENVVKYAPGFFYWKDKNSVYLGCNDEFARFAGLQTREQVIGKTDFDLVWKERAAQYVEVDQKVIKTGKAKFNHEEMITVSQDRTITAITNKVPLLDNKGRVIGMMGITTDITNQKNTEEALRQAKMAAESANILKTNFIQNMQHDIRTPASSVWAVLENLVENRQTPDHELLVMLKNSAKQLWSICNDVIDFDRIEQGTIPILAKRLDIRQIVNNIIELNQTAAFERGLSLVSAVDEKIPLVKGDEHRISRILINLMSNALKFTSDGFISLSANLVEERDKDYIIQFKLQDTGIGIPPDKQNTLYEKFNRLNPANRTTYKGSGLGLRIVKKYVDDVGGEINVHSELNKGTTFFIDIPFEKTLVQTLYEENPLEVREKKAPKKDKELEVLLVEDDILARKIAKMILESIHCQVTVAPDLSKAIKEVNSKKFDFVISDIGLPDGSGNDLVKQSKDHAQALNFATPFIALTANVDELTLKNSKKAGFEYVIAKPLGIETLNYLMNELILPKNQKNQLALLECKSEKLLGADLPPREKDLFKLEQFPLVDIENSIANLGSEEILLEMLKDMLDTIPNDIKELQQSFTLKNWQQIENIAHRIKGGAAYCGTIRMRYACQYLERYQKAGYSAVLEKLYQQLIEVLKETQKWLQQWLAEQQ